MAHIAVLLAFLATLCFSITLLFTRSLYSCAIAFLGVLMQTSILYYFFGAPLLAFLQLMIYAGAIMVLIVITIMATSAKQPPLWGRLSPPWSLGIAAIVLPALEILIIVSSAPLPSFPATPVGFPTGALGQILFGPYALATEAVTLLLLFAGLAVGNSPKANP